MESERNLWEALRALWIKYCGVADEYQMLRDRWLYLYKENSLNTLPYLRSRGNGTFDLLDKHIDYLDTHLQKKFNLNREVMESFEVCKEKIRKANLEEYKTLLDGFFDLSVYIGLLKLAFFQRTVSSEISHVASGVPHSPERTIGNETFYLAADTVAKRLYNCLNLNERRIRWDGFITFAAPITMEHFHGGFFKPTGSLKLFHISMSEEQKYFVGSYSVLGHEFGHAAIYNLQNQEGRERSKFDEYRESSINTAKKSWRERTDRCDNCPYKPENMFFYLGKRDPFNEYFADLIAIKLNGRTFVSALLNQLTYIMDGGVTFKDPPSFIVRRPLGEPILRFGGTIHYLRLMGEPINDLESRFNDLMKWSKEVILAHIKKEKSKQPETVVGYLPERDKCFSCLIDMGRSWTDFMFSADDYWTANTIKQAFDEERPDYEVIKQKLIDGKPCADEDPRHILHAYYEAYKKSNQGDDRPHYPATIHSLAFNKYGKKKEEGG